MTCNKSFAAPSALPHWLQRVGHAPRTHPQSQAGHFALALTVLQVTKPAKRKASGVDGMTEKNVQAGESGRAAEAANTKKGRKRKAQDAAGKHAPLAEASAGTVSAQPAKRTKVKAAGVAGHLEKPASKHAQKPAAAQLGPSAQKRTAPHTAEKKAREKIHVAEADRDVPVPADSLRASDSQPAGSRPAQRRQSAGTDADTGIAGALGEHSGNEGETSADEMADAEEPAARTAGGTAGAKPKLTEEQRQERLQRTVFVGNLPATVKAKRLKQAFSQCGSHLFYVPDSLRPVVMLRPL